MNHPLLNKEFIPMRRPDFYPRNRIHCYAINKMGRTTSFKWPKMGGRRTDLCTTCLKLTVDVKRQP